MRNNAIQASLVLTLIGAALGVMALAAAGEPSHAQATKPTAFSSVSVSAPTANDTTISDTRKDGNRKDGTRTNFTKTVTTITVPFTVAPEFEPENGELGNCMGSFAERPGCGATGRGGWHQTLVFLALVAGLAFIATRIIIGVRRTGSQT